MKPLTNAEIARLNAETLARHSTKTPGLRIYPPQRSLDLLGGRQLVGYDHAAEVRVGNGVVYTGSWAECLTWAAAKGHLPAHVGV